MNTASNDTGKKQDVSKNSDVRQQQDKENKNVAAAHEQAEKDMAQDADLSIHSPNDDLDEGETARLGEENTGLI